MTDFIINTPSHKRWRLPDGKHIYNCVIHGHFLHISVWNEFRNELVLRVPPIDMRKDGWQDLADTAQALAEKKFRYISKPDQFRLQGHRR